MSGLTYSNSVWTDSAFSKYFQDCALDLEKDSGPESTQRETRQPEAYIVFLNAYHDASERESGFV